MPGDLAQAEQEDPADEVSRMLEAVVQAEREVRDSFARLDGWLEQGRTQLVDAAGTPDWRWSLIERVAARVRTLLDPQALRDAQREARERLEAGDVAGARERVVDTMRPFMDRGDEASMLMAYVPRRVVAELGVARLRALLRGNGVESTASARIVQLEALLAARESRDDFAMAAEVELAELETLHAQAYDAAFQAAFSKARAQPASALAYRPRTARCPLAADTGTPGDAPRLDTTLSAPTADYYPRDALDQEIEGKVALSARVDAQGCVRAAAVLVSAGVEALDAAALRWMLEGAVYRRSAPRADGQPATTSLSVNFKAGD
ncbi:MAG: energy transducer TonB [Steroidobacteraceae bacterium]|nr:energy transducer TonB [Steroidobacteraceae bacterium]